MGKLDYITINKKQIGPDLQIAPIVFRAKQAVKFLNEKQRVLVVGCANGQDCEIFINNGHEVFGTDIIFRRLHSAKQKCERIFCANAINLPFVEKGFHCVYAGEFIEHLSFEDGRLFLKEISRVLKKDGKLIMTTPNPDYIIVKLKKMKMIRAAHLSCYSADQLKKLLGDLNYENIKIKGSGRVAMMLGDYFP